MSNDGLRKIRNIFCFSNKNVVQHHSSFYHFRQLLRHLIHCMLAMTLDQLFNINSISTDLAPSFSHHKWVPAAILSRVLSKMGQERAASFWKEASLGHFCILNLRQVQWDDTVNVSIHWLCDCLSVTLGNVAKHHNLFSNLAWSS